jgi:Tn3 transposase DDE domain
MLQPGLVRKEDWQHKDRTPADPDFLLRHGQGYPGPHWSKGHRRWLGELTFAQPAQHLVLEAAADRASRGAVRSPEGSDRRAAAAMEPGAGCPGGSGAARRARRGRTPEQLAAISGALTLLANLVMAWNTWKMQALRDHAPERYSDELMARIAPTAHRHIVTVVWRAPCGSADEGEDKGPEARGAGPMRTHPALPARSNRIIAASRYASLWFVNWTIPKRFILTFAVRAVLPRPRRAAPGQRSPSSHPERSRPSIACRSTMSSR